MRVLMTPEKLRALEQMVEEAPNAEFYGASYIAFGGPLSFRARLQPGDVFLHLIARSDSDFEVLLDDYEYERKQTDQVERVLSVILFPARMSRETFDGDLVGFTITGRDGSILEFGYGEEYVTRSGVEQWLQSVGL